MYDYSQENHRIIFMIDSKSFYASVESVMRGLHPLKSILVVMSTAENTGSGLVLAASPMAKKRLGISNVTRARDVPRQDARLIIAPPRMNLYIKENARIQHIFRQFTAEEDIQPYSIDESLLDMTDSWSLFGVSPVEVARKIQLAVKAATGIYLTVGIGDNPLLAKLALDLEAKQSRSLIAQWHYEDVPNKLWPITQLTRVWSIGQRTAEQLNRYQIYSLADLAHTNPYLIKQKFGVLGSQLFALSWGIDRALMRQPYRPQVQSYSNSQVLPRDYQQQAAIEIVIREITEQVAARLRAHHQAATVITLGIGYAFAEKKQQAQSGFGHSAKVTATNSNRLLTKVALQLFRERWHGEILRHISITCGGIVTDQLEQLDLFTPAWQQAKQRQLDHTIDSIRQRYGFAALVKLSSKAPGATAISRAGLVGGHAGGNVYE